MIDTRFIREQPELVVQKAKQKGYDIDIARLVEMESKRATLVPKIENLQSERNTLARKGKSGNPHPEDIQRGKQIKSELTKLERELEPINKEYFKALGEIPNVFPDDTPLGGEENNREEKKWGDTALKNFKVVDHLTWGEQRGLIDFERGTKVAGAKFYFTKGSLVELEIAILQFGLKLAKEHGFIPMLVPHLVNSRIIDGAGFTAKSDAERQIYKVEDEDLNLIATAEIPMTGYHADEILAEDDLPKLYAGYSPAYRVEAGAYGKHSKGLYRVHQFNKLELYVFCKPQESEQWHQKMVALEEDLCQKLEIPYRLVRIAAGDLGAPAYKKYDVEYWSPVDKNYRELMSCSNVTDYQARRLNIRYKSLERIKYVHTLNGTAAAMSRMPIAIIENFQTADGKVHVPEALQAYMAGSTEI
ncbi:MAG TPA: serine--tRNA ligase [Candidatus Saccharimonadales bacterium]|nr:serine--tRNA ligase [Candidatus Saccharimonadales bacterium]